MGVKQVLFPQLMIVTPIAVKFAKSPVTDEARLAHFPPTASSRVLLMGRKKLALNWFYLIALPHTG